MEHHEHNNRVQTLLLVSILILLVLGLLLVGLSSKPQDVLERAERMEQKLETRPLDVLEQVKALREEK